MTSWILPKRESRRLLTATRRVEKGFPFRNQMQAKRKDTLLGAFSVLALPIFPGASARQVSWAEANLTDLSRDGRPSRFSSINQTQVKRKDTLLGAFSVLALPIFPGRLQPSIVGRSELNFRVRDGNGWTLALISTNYEVYCTFKTEQCIT